MKILHLLSSMNPVAGGVTQAVRGIHAALNLVGGQGEVVTLDSPDSEWLLREAEIEIRPLGPGYSGWKFSPRLVDWLGNNLERFDAVIVHGLWQFHTYAIVQAAERMANSVRCPKIYLMPHGMLDPWFQRDPSRRVKAIRNWLLWKLLEKKIVHISDVLLFTCEEEKFLAREAFRPYSPKKEEVVGLGVDQPPIYHSGMKVAFEKQCSQTVGRLYILFLGRVDPKKGVDLLIRAYAQLSSEKQILPHLVIAGPGAETKYGLEMQDLAVTLCPRNSVSFVGMLSGDAKWGAFYGCEAFVLPSHQENFGIAVVEALACGKPVLISNRVNIWREIKGHDAGIVGNDDVDGVFAMLQTLLDLSSEARTAMAECAVKCYNDLYKPDKAANRLFEVLRS